MFNVHRGCHSLRLRTAQLRSVPSHGTSGPNGPRVSRTCVGPCGLLNAHYSHLLYAALCCSMLLYAALCCSMLLVL